MALYTRALGALDLSTLPSTQLLESDPLSGSGYCCKELTLV